LFRFFFACLLVYRMKLVIRGHIRDSFQTDSLYQFVRQLCSIIPDITIYIHTWSIFSNSISWRKIPLDSTAVTEDTIVSYFVDVKDLIRSIRIDRDEDVELVGRCTGTINGGPMPIVGWKNYWFGQYSVLKYLHGLDPTSSESVLNMRFDLFSNFNSTKTSVSHCLDFVGKHGSRHDFVQNVFLFDDEAHCGIDNIFIGNISTQFRLARAFHFDLDSILELHGDTVHQEFLVFRVDRSLVSSSE